MERREQRAAARALSKQSAKALRAERGWGTVVRDEVRVGASLGTDHGVPPRPQESPDFTLSVEETGE